MMLAGLLGGIGIMQHLTWSARLENTLRLRQGARLATLKRRAGFGGRKGRAARRRLRRLEAFHRWWERNSARLRHAAHRESPALTRKGGSPLKIESQITALATVPWMRAYLGCSAPLWLRGEAGRTVDPFWADRTVEALIRQGTRWCVALALTTLTLGTRFVHPSEVNAS
jgi:hypothetical protein